LRVGTPSAVARPDWYDRNPVVQNNYYTGVVVPHTETERWTYTVPAGKKAMVEHLSLFMRRTTAPTTVGLAALIIYYRPSSGGETILCGIEFSDATAETYRALALGHNITMLAGDRLRAATFDLSTGGYVKYVAAAKVVEFDA